MKIKWPSCFAIALAVAAPSAAGGPASPHTVCLASPHLHAGHEHHLEVVSGGQHLGILNFLHVRSVDHGHELVQLHKHGDHAVALTIAGHEDLAHDRTCLEFHWLGSHPVELELHDRANGTREMFHLGAHAEHSDHSHGAPDAKDGVDPTHGDHHDASNDAKHGSPSLPSSHSEGSDAGRHPSHR